MLSSRRESKMLRSAVVVVVSVVVFVVVRAPRLAANTLESVPPVVKADPVDAVRERVRTAALTNSILCSNFLM
jgi:hypothetical protein